MVVPVVDAVVEVNVHDIVDGFLIKSLLGEADGNLKFAAERGNGIVNCLRVGGDIGFCDCLGGGARVDSNACLSCDAELGCRARLGEDA